MTPKGQALAEEVPRKAWGWERSFCGQAPSPDLTSSSRAKNALALTPCQTWHIVSFSPPQTSEPASVAFPFTRRETSLKEVNCSDLEPPLGNGIAGFDSRSFPCHGAAHALLPPLHGPPFASSLGHIPGPRLEWCPPSNNETDMLPSAGAVPGTHSQSCLLLFFLLSILGFLLLLGFPLGCPHPSTEHRKVSHGHSQTSLLCTGHWAHSSCCPEFCSIWR